MKNKKTFVTVFFLLTVFLQAFSQEKMLNLNKPQREKWFSNLGFGMFIHWSMDVQLGTIISHSMVGASDDYLKRYIDDLPKTFNPTNFKPEQWAKAAKLAGMKYVVFTTKHHNGFCMFNTKTTTFSIANTPYKKDITQMVVDAFRKEGIAIGLYFSPDDFYFLHKQGTLISRERPEALASHNPELNSYAKKQMTELMTNYGKIDIVFLDGLDQFGKTELAKVCWKINPDVVVTRGAIQTPEQVIPDKPIKAPWEACYTLGQAWQFQPTNENYKSGNEAIKKLIEIRAKGGNLLLNFGPDAEGNFPPEQLAILNEISLWNFINQEALENTVACPVIKEGTNWFLKNEKDNSLYVFLTESNWKYKERKTIQLKSLKANSNAKILLLGHNGKVLEYITKANPEPTIISKGDEGIEISVMNAQRIYDGSNWPNPLVVKLDNVEFKN
ncbi:alpha-L-fucosidase [Flavobacterium fluvii]|uniref:alpha-L-fucosidase n=1 Tax=Flavobacterium fluvii TaxID=468056 RepID=A0A1M5JW32_9FLAO|nr:alpha-L-fucosidase [Flavobacterium fluvii]SHG44802.1 alpha-L-fucosidase [Flavobacterium fluvii]